MARLGSLADTPQSAPRKPATTPRGAPVSEIGHAGTAGSGSIVPWGNLQDFVDFFEDVPQLRWPTSVFTYSKMRTDAQLTSLWLGTTLPIRRYHWCIDPNGARDEVTQMIAEDLNLPINNADEEDPDPEERADSFNHDDHLRQALLALIFGHMFFEQVGNIDDETLDWRLGMLAARMPYSISEVNVGRNGNLSYIKQYASGAIGGGFSFSGQTPPIPETQLVPYIWEREGANWLGRSMFRPCYKHWLIKDRLLRVDAIKHERNGVGVPIAKGAPGMTKPQLDDLARMAMTYKVGEAAGGALPNGTDLVFKGVEGNVPDTLASIRYQDEQMAKVWLGMVNELGQTSHGSRALGETMGDSWMLGQMSMATWYAKVTNMHVIRDIVDWNFGEDESAPRLIFHPHEDRELAVQELFQLVESGALTVDDDTENWIRDMWNMPKRDPNLPGRESTRIVPIPGGDTSDPTTGPTDITDSDITVNVPPVKAIARRMKASLRAAPANPGRGWFRRNRPRASRTPRAAAPGIDTGSGQTLNRGAGWVGHRQPSTLEAAAGTDYAAIQSAWDTATTAAVNAYTKAQQAQVDQMTAEIERAVDADEVNSLSTFLPDSVGSDVLARHMIELAHQSIGHARNEAQSQGVSIPLPDTSDMEAALQERAIFVSDLMGRNLGVAMSSKAAALAGPESKGSAIADAVRSYFSNLGSSYLNDFIGGVMTQAQNTGRFTAMAATDRPASFYASELLDDATCDECANIDGTEYASLDDAQDDYPTGGFKDCAGGQRCRGTVVAVYGDET